MSPFSRAEFIFWLIALNKIRKLYKL